MKKFHVTVYDRVKRTYMVEAETEEEAGDQFEDSNGTLEMIEEIDDMDGDIDKIVEVL